MRNYLVIWAYFVIMVMSQEKSMTVAGQPCSKPENSNLEDWIQYSNCRKVSSLSGRYGKRSYDDIPNVVNPYLPHGSDDYINSDAEEDFLLKHIHEYLRRKNKYLS